MKAKKRIKALERHMGALTFAIAALAASEARRLTRELEAKASKPETPPETPSPVRFI
jgi:hypothetical protein